MYVTIVLHIAPMFDSLLYTKFVVTFLLTVVQLFDDMLLFVLVIITLMSFVFVAMIIDLM
jgi:hypothetical protein